MDGQRLMSPQTPAAVACDWHDWFAATRGRVDAAIAAEVRRLESVSDPHSRLAASVCYSLSRSGKRLRPVLVLESCRVCGAAEEAAWPAAVAVECIHTFSLIHDDLPAMDDDDLRRGQPTNHKVFGEAQAILAGDWLAAYPFALLTSRYPPAVSAKLVAALAAGTLGMIEGQAADVDNEERPPEAGLVDFIHERKTARLIEAACRMGAICAGSEAAGLGTYGIHLGLAFQITDDLLDVTSSTETLGKQAHKDAAAAKQTYPAVHGIDASRARARRQVELAIAALEEFGPGAERLRDLARYVLLRDR